MSTVVGAFCSFTCSDGCGGGTAQQAYDPNRQECNVATLRTSDEANLTMLSDVCMTRVLIA